MIENALGLLVGNDFTEVVEVEDYFQLLAGPYTLTVYNPLRIDETEKVTTVSRTVTSVVNTDDAVEIVLADGTHFHVDLRDEAWTGPEALVLDGPNDLIVVLRSDD